MTHICSELKPTKILILHDFTVEQCIYVDRQTSVPLNSPSHFFSNCKAQKAGIPCAASQEVGGRSFTSGWLSAGNLELQLVANIESLTNRKIKEEWFLQLLRSIFRKLFGIEDGMIF